MITRSGARRPRHRHRRRCSVRHRRRRHELVAVRRPALQGARRRRLLPSPQGLRRHRKGRHPLRGHGEPRDAALRGQDRARTAAVHGAVEARARPHRPAAQVRHDHAGADRHVGGERLLRIAARADPRLEHGDARGARRSRARRLLDHSDGGAEHSPRRHSACGRGICSTSSSSWMSSTTR